MPKNPTVAANNVFCIARKEAASFNDTLNSREGAAELLGIDRTRLARIELGSLNPYPEEVLLMSDAYNAPELNNHYCTQLCPLGRKTVQPAQLLQLDRLTIKIIAALGEAEYIPETIVKIVQDGIISEDEKPQVWGTYKVGPYRPFYVTIPKLRLVMALQFRDRVVQHAIYRCMNPFYDRMFIEDSYHIKTTDGGDFIAFVSLPSKQIDTDYVSVLQPQDLSACGSMTRYSDKYPVYSWSVDTKYCSRKGRWKNNFTSDYEYLYEFITGEISENSANADKFKRLRERKYLTDDNKVNIMVVNGKAETSLKKYRHLTMPLKRNSPVTHLKLPR